MFNPLHFILKRMARKEMRKNRADLYFDIATSLEDRVPLFTTFRKYEARARRRKPGEALVYLDMLRALSSGSLTNALKSIAPNSELLMIDALQSAGDLKMAEGLRFLSQTAEKTDAMAKAASKAVKYPISMLVLFSAMLTGFSLHIVPILSGLLPPDKWPFLGRILYTISQLITHYGVYFLIGVIAASFAFTYSLPITLQVLSRLFGGHAGGLAVHALAQWRVFALIIGPFAGLQFTLDAISYPSHPQDSGQCEHAKFRRGLQDRRAPPG